MMKGKMCGGHKIASLLVIIGGLNWGLIAINPDWDLVQMLLGSWPMVVRLVYGLVGLAAIMMLIKHKCKACQVDAGKMKKDAAPMGDNM